MKFSQLSPVWLTRLIALPLALSGVVLLMWTANQSQARNDGELIPIAGGRYDDTFDELSAEERVAVWEDLTASRARLTERGILPMAGERIVGLDMPLRSAETNPFSSNYQPWFIANYVDQNQAFPNQTTDHACGERTYDTSSGYNHQGTDFFLWPTPWRQMEEGRVEVVAAAPAVILKKQDGNYDKHCSITNATWNAVYVEHADGSIAWYGHLKTGTLTDKNVGDTLARGEYVGLIGSSGRSSGPHLHFELYNSDNELVDPYSGGCNQMNERSWWMIQEPYYDSSITGILVGTSSPVSNGCGLAESVFEQSAYAPGSNVVFTLYFRDHRPGMRSEFALYQPDGTLYNTWTYYGSSYEASALWASWERQVGEQTGTWRLDVVYGGETWQQVFEVSESASFQQQAPTTVSLATSSADHAVGSMGVLTIAIVLTAGSVYLGIKKRPDRASLG